MLRSLTVLCVVFFGGIQAASAQPNFHLIRTTAEENSHSSEANGVMSTDFDFAGFSAIVSATISPGSPSVIVPLPLSYFDVFVDQFGNSIDLDIIAQTSGSPDHQAIINHIGWYHHNALFGLQPGVRGFVLDGFDQRVRGQFDVVKQPISPVETTDIEVSFLLEWEWGGGNGGWAVERTWIAIDIYDGDRLPGNLLYQIVGDNLSGINIWNMKTDTLVGTADPTLSTVGGVIAFDNLYIPNPTRVSYDVGFLTETTLSATGNGDPQYAETLASWSLSFSDTSTLGY